MAFLTTQQVAGLLKAEVWQVRRLFTEGDLPEPDKFAGKRLIPSALVPRIRKAMLARGWQRRTARERV